MLRLASRSGIGTDVSCIAGYGFYGNHEPPLI
jgi:hypothetical protein